MFERILLAVDGSDVALGAARVAARLATSMSIPIRALTVFDQPSTNLGEPGYSAALRSELREAEAALAAAAAAIREAGGPEPELDQIAGRPAESILEVAAGQPGTLIVMGNRGRGRVASALLGSVSTAVVSRATGPVLVVPAAD